MADILADAFRAEIPCDGPVAASLAARVRRSLPAWGGDAEDTDEDLVLRLRDPRAFGAFVETLLPDPALDALVRRALVEHVFDLLPLPRTEGEVIQVESRAPPHLLALAAVLEEGEGLTILHVMHLVFAVFLDRSLVTAVPRRTRSAILGAILGRSEGEEDLRALYAALHLSAVTESEAVSELRRILDDSTVPMALRRSIASLAASNDGGRGELSRLARKQGLIPADLEDLQSPEILANIPRVPARLAPAAQRFLAED